MGRYIQQNEGRSQLQQRLAAELRAKAAAKAKQEGEVAASDYARPDGVEDAAFLKGTKATTTLAPVWAVIIVAAIAIIGFFIWQMSQ